MQKSSSFNKPISQNLKSSNKTCRVFFLRKKKAPLSLPFSLFFTQIGVSLATQRSRIRTLVRTPSPPHTHTHTHTHTSNQDQNSSEQLSL